MKLLKDSTGKLIAFGDGDGYEPFVADGNTLEIVSNEEAQPLIAAFVAEFQVG